MFRLLVALVAFSALSSPALAGYPYFGIEGGPARAKDNDIDETVEFRTTPGAVSEPVKYDDVFAVQYKRGLDLGVVAGFDFGWVRLEGELAEKRVRLTRSINDDITDLFLEELNAGLNRPSEAPDPGAPGLPALTIADFQPSGRLKVASAMANVLLDVPITDRFDVYAGAGIGRSFARGFDDRDSARAYQYIYGARYAVSDRLGLGLKYRNFKSGIIKLDHDPIDYSGNPDLVTQGGTSIVQTTNAAVTPDIEGEFRTRTLLVSLIYNLR